MVGILRNVLYLVVLVFFLFLLARLILDWVQVFARSWRPRGVALILAEATYTVTDPPLKAIRRVVPPLNLGGLRLDLAFLLLMILCSVLLNVIPLL
ncbi:MAG TPA: YggT family protein [Actinotalea sp.]|jgi:YggT family protein